MTPPPMNFREAVEALRKIGIALRQLPGEYSVNFRNGRPETEYRTVELADAIAHAMGMGEAPVPLPPLGPMGKGLTRRGLMYRHNRKVAARRRKQQTVSPTRPAQ